MKKLLAFLLCLTLILIQLPSGIQTAYAAQQTADFESLGYSDDQKITPINTSIDGFVFCGQTNGADVGMIYTTNLGDGSSAAVYPDYAEGAVSQLSIKRDDNSSFKLTSIWLNADGVGSYEVKIEGYLGDSLVAGCSELNVDITSATTVSPNWTDLIDEIRITATSQDNGSYDIAATIDNIVYDDLSNTPPSITVNSGLNLNEGATASLQSALSATDSEQDDSTLTYTITDLPDNGVLKNNGSTLYLNGTFTQAQLNAGNISYTHDDTNTTSDSFTFKVSDGTNELTGQTFSITVNAVDDDPPTVSITSAYSDPTNSFPLTVTITFNEDVSGFDFGDIRVGNGSICGFINTVANRVWTINFTPMSNGAVTVDVDDDVCTDAAGNGNIAATQFSIDYDGTAPNATITSPESDPTNNSPFSATITFNEDVSGFVQGDITVGNGNASNFTNTVPNRVWTADITPLGDGTVTVDVNAGVSTDAAGNGNTAATQFSVDYDATAPNATITSSESDPTNSSPFTVTITFDEDVSGFVQGDIMVGNGNASNFTNTVPNRVWTADITPSGDGTVTVDVNAGVCTDAAGNGNTAATQFSVDYDATTPNVTITSPESDPTNNSPFTVTITFDEDVSGFTVGDIAVGNGNASNFTNTVPNKVWTADITPSGDGTVTVDVNADVCTDAAGNGNDAATQFSLEYDVTSPTVAITSGESDSTNSSPFTVTFTFDEDISGFGFGDIMVGNGNASNFINTVANRVWTADITPLGDGTVTVDVNAGVCTDAAGNGNTAATQFSIDYDTTAPTVVTNTGLIVNEGAAETITTTQLSAKDAEADDTLLVYTVTILPMYGVLKNNGSTLYLNGTFTQQDIIDGEIRYVHNGSETTSDSFVFKVADNAQNVLTGQTFNITVTPVNDDPIIWMLPYGITVYEDTASNVDLSGATFYDADAGSSSITLNITASAGTLSASSGGGVTVGGAGTSTLTLYGTVTNTDSYLNTASNIRYTGAANVYGNDAATLTLTANDGGNTGIGGGTNVTLGTVNIDITAVNDDPTISILPTDITVYEDTESNVDLSVVTISDVDAGSSSITLNITASAGTLSASSGGGVTVGGAGTSTLTLYGTVANIDSYLNTASNILYTGAANVYGNDAATLTLTANDGGNTGAGGGTNVNLGTVNVDIEAVNDDPDIWMLPYGIMVYEDTASNVDLSAAAFYDVDAGSSSISLNITASAGTFSATSGGGVTVGGAGTSTLTLYGTVANIDSYLNTASNILYTGAANAYGNDAATLTLTANDGGNTGIGGGTNVTLGTVNIDITAVNDDPTISILPTDITVYEDTESNVDLSVVTISDVDAGSSSITLNITASAGTLSATSGGGVIVAGAGTSTLTLYGTVANIDTYLNTASNIRYTGAANVYGNDAATLTLTANDGGNTGTGGGTNVNLGTVNVDIAAVNDAPTIVTNTGLTLNEGGTKSITIDELKATDVDTDDATLVYTVTASPLNGQLENTDNPGISISSFTQQNLIDSKIQYVHDSSNTTSDSFTFKVSDGEGGVLTGQTFSITVNAVDDDVPTMVKNEGLALNQGESETITTTELLATDADSADNLLVFTVMTQPSNGQLENSDYPGVSISIFTQQNLVDGKIRYVHDDSNTTSDSFTFNVSDNNANVLSGQTFGITINLAPVPTITPSPTQTPGENTRTISGMLLDSNGNPKVGYVVELHSTPITAITDSQGRYRFDNVDYTAHTLFVNTPTGQPITSFDLAFEEGDEFSNKVTSDRADIKYANSTVSVEITIALDDDEDSAEIIELSGVDNPATGRTLSMLIWVLIAALAVCSIGWVVIKRIRTRA